MSEEGLGSHEDRDAFQLTPEQTFTSENCFLCGVELHKANRTREHVFPKWLIRLAGLEAQTLTLLNRTTIPYSQLTIPCCSECNGVHLSAVESRVKRAFLSGAEAVTALDQVDLFIWLAKLHYGLQFRDLSLIADQTSTGSEPILTLEMLSQFRFQHFLLQAARGAVVWPPDQFPASIFIFESQVPSNPRLRFDYSDALYFPFVSVRIGGVVVLASLQDWGAMKSQEIPMFNAAAQLELHPTQYRQLHAMGVYMASLFNQVPKHVIAGSEPATIITMPFQSSGRLPLFREFEVESYASALADALGQPIDEIFDGVSVVDLIGRDDSLVVVPAPPDEWVTVRLMNKDVDSAPE
jgi:hypothetical protein